MSGNGRNEAWDTGIDYGDQSKKNGYTLFLGLSYIHIHPPTGDL